MARWASAAQQRERSQADNQISPRRSKRAKHGDDVASRHTLEEELRATRAELQSTIEQMDGVVEQQKARMKK
jgi:hypothetical protein